MTSVIDFTKLVSFMSSLTRYSSKSTRFQVFCTQSFHLMYFVGVHRDLALYFHNVEVAATIMVIAVAAKIMNFSDIGASIFPWVHTFLAEESMACSDHTIPFYSTDYTQFLQSVIYKDYRYLANTSHEYSKNNRNETQRSSW